MDPQVLENPDVQRRIRSLVYELMIEENHTVYDIRRISGLGLTMVYRFLNNKSEEKVGKKAMCKIVHYLIKAGRYKWEEIINKGA